MPTTTTETPAPNAAPAPTPAPPHDAILAALEETRAELARARDDLKSTVRSMAIDRALAEAGARDLAAARAKLDDTPGADPAALVAALRTRQPALFAPRPRIAPGLSTSTPRAGDTDAPVRIAAARAAAGDRRALMDYMRLRRVPT